MNFAKPPSNCLFMGRGGGSSPLEICLQHQFSGLYFLSQIMLGTSLLIHVNVTNTYHVVENFFFQESVFYIFIQSSSTHADYYSLKRNSLDPPTLAV